MDVLSVEDREFLKLKRLERCERKFNLLSMHVDKILDATCLNNLGKVETLNEAQVTEVFEQLISKYDVSNVSDDAKWKRDMEEIVSTSKKKLNLLGEEHETVKKEFESSKNQVATLNQELNIKRKEFKEAHEKMTEMEKNFKNEKLSLENQIVVLKKKLADREKNEKNPKEDSVLKNLLSLQEEVDNTDEKSNTMGKECTMCQEYKHEKKVWKKFFFYLGLG